MLGDSPPLFANVKTVEGVRTSNLSDYSLDAEFLKRSVQYWLDSEYIPQEIHTSLGLEVARVYRSCRAAGMSDMSDILIGMGTALEGFDMKDAFVNAWDVANKVSDLLFFRMGMETSQCAGDMQAFGRILDQINAENGDNILPLLSYKELKQFIRTYSSSFARFGLLRRILEGESSLVTSFSAPNPRYLPPSLLSLIQEKRSGKR